MTNNVFFVNSIERDVKNKIKVYVNRVSTNIYHAEDHMPDILHFREVNQYFVSDEY